MPDTVIASSRVTPAFVDKLRAIVGDKGLVLDRDEMERYTTDWRRIFTGSAPAVVRPASSEEVAAVVKLCHDAGVSIIPQAGNTSLVGAGTPFENGESIILSVNRMNRVIEVDPLNYTMTVETGCILRTLQETAAAADRLFPLSLGAEGSCLIGGNLSTNAGGVQVLHYGNTRNLVLGLEVVLPDGRIWNGLRSLKKDNTGYDLKHLFIGGEGTLGVITKVVLKLFPKPKDVATAWLQIRDPQAAIEILSGAYSASEDNVTSCELLHRTALDQVFRHIPNVVDPLPARHTWFLLMEWSSSRPAVEGVDGMNAKMEQYLGEQIEKGSVLDAVVCQSEGQRANMWKIRESHAEASRAEGPAASYDISVATAKIPAFLKLAMPAVEKDWPGVRLYPFGHVGDGNLHFSMSAPPGSTRDDVKAVKPTLDRTIHDLVRDFNGSISAEHGIGREKIGELEHYRSQTELDVMRAIKRALDPKNIMNPGKVVRV